MVLLTPNQISSKKIAVSDEYILSSINQRDIHLPGFLTWGLLSLLETLKWKYTYRRMDCDSIHFEDYHSPEIFPVTLVRFPLLLSTNIRTSLLQNLNPSFNLIALSAVIVNFTSHLCNVVQDLLLLSHQPASVQPPDLSSTGSYVAACQQECCRADTQRLIASEIPCVFSKLACEKCFDFSRLHGGGIIAGRHPPCSPPSQLTYSSFGPKLWRMTWLK